MKFFAKDVAHCSRQACMYLYQSPEKEELYSAASALYMNMGTAAHETLAEAFKKANILVASEYHIPDLGLNIGGRIDNLLMVDGKLRILEIKTCGAQPSAVKPDHRLQVLVYAIATGIANPIVLYLSRDVADYTGALKLYEFEVNASQEELMAVATEMCLSYYSALTKKLPPVPVRFKTKSACGYCPFVDICWSGNEAPAETMNDETYLGVLKIAQTQAKQILDSMDKRREKIEKELLNGKEEDKHESGSPKAD